MRTYRVPDHVFHRAVHDEVVILNGKNNEYLGLNASAAVIWQALADDGQVESAVDQLTGRFNVERDEATADVAELISTLLARDLLEPVS